MTNEQKLLSYLYTIDSIQRRQLVIALSDMPYQSLTLAVRNAVKHGYVEVFRKDESNHIRISQDEVYPFGSKRLPRQRETSQYEAPF